MENLPNCLNKGKLTKLFRLGKTYVNIRENLPNCLYKGKLTKLLI